MLRPVLLLLPLLVSCTPARASCHVQADIGFQRKVAACEREHGSDYDARRDCLGRAGYDYDRADEACLGVE